MKKGTNNRPLFDIKYYYMPVIEYLAVQMPDQNLVMINVIAIRNITDHNAIVYDTNPNFRHINRSGSTYHYNFPSIKYYIIISIRSHSPNFLIIRQN
jgi:hypothetical protein